MRNIVFANQTEKLEVLEQEVAHNRVTILRLSSQLAGAQSLLARHGIIPRPEEDNHGTIKRAVQEA